MLVCIAGWSFKALRCLLPRVKCKEERGDRSGEMNRFRRGLVYIFIIQE